MRDKRSLKNLIVTKRQTRLVIMIGLVCALFYFTLALFVSGSVLSKIATLAQNFDLQLTFQQQVITIVYNAFLELSVAGMTLTFLIIAASVIITHRFFGPQVQILKFIKALRAGDYSQRITLRASDELTELSDELNQLAAELQKSRMKGFSLVEVMVTLGILMVVLLAASTFFTQQLKANQYLEFQAKKEQLRLLLLGQVLPNPNNCRCLFADAAPFPNAGIQQLQNFTPPSAIGKFAQANCAGGTTSPFVTTDGIDSLRLVSATVRNISLSAGSYSGDLEVAVESMKEVLGPKTLTLKIPVTVLVTPVNAANVRFAGCTTSAAGGAGGSGASIFANWPNTLNCGGTVWTIYRQGIYHCYGGGENSTRTDIMYFNLANRRYSSRTYNTDNNKCPSTGGCQTLTMDELIAAGLAK